MTGNGRCIWQVRPGQIFKGNCNTKIDIYALGIISLTMIAGYPQYMEVRRRMYKYSDEVMDMEDAASQDYHFYLWFWGEKKLTPIQREALRNASNQYEKERLGSIDEFMDLLSRIENEFALAKVCANYKVYSPSPLPFRQKQTFRRILKKN